MTFTPGERLGPYEILARIGVGGMGEVWKARDPRVDRLVAIKVSKAEFSERFAREARAIAQLNHPHICQLYDVGPNFLLLEYVEGSQLKGPIAVEKAVEYAGQILSALDAAHRKGITHRDLKPANILVTRQGIKLHVRRCRPDADGQRDGHSRLYVAGAVRGQAGRRAQRYLRVWVRAV